MADLPPLPEPGFQSPDDRRAIGRRFIFQAAQYLLQGDRLQAGEKAWGAIAHNLKAIGEVRGWKHGSHQQIENIGRQIVVEFDNAELGNAIAEAFQNGHRNFYENHRTIEEMTVTIEAAEEALPMLEALQQASPHPFTITSNTQLRRLRALTANDDLHIGDSSPVGFSQRHSADNDDKANNSDSEQ
jgi:hypothetical protein